MPARAPEVTVAPGIILMKSVGATTALRRHARQEDEEEEGYHLLAGVQLGLKVQPEARRMDPLVAVGLVILMGQRGRAEEEATLAEKLSDPLQGEALEAQPILVLYAKASFLDN